MTEEQKTKIEELRKAGYGYQAIANLLGINRDNVRYHAKKIGLDGEKAKSKRRISNSGLLCLCCGSPIIQKPGKRQRLFCSDKCRYTGWNKHSGIKKQNGSKQRRCVCPQCGKVFYSYPSSHKKYCSTTCYMAHRFGSGKEND